MIRALFNTFVSVFLCALLSALILTVPVGVGWVIAQVVPFSWFQATVTVIFLSVGIATVAILDSMREEFKKISSMLLAIWNDTKDDDYDDEEDGAYEDEEDDDYDGELEHDLIWRPRDTASDPKTRLKRLETRKRQRQARKRQRK